MVSAPAPGPRESEPSDAVRTFVQRHYIACGAGQFGMDEHALEEILADVLAHAGLSSAGLSEEDVLASIRLDELVLARACAAGNDRAWEIFLTRYRATLYETAYKVAKEDSAAHSLADSLYAELYGVDGKGQQRSSKLLYYQGRGSLQGWLRTVVAQEWINRCRSSAKETSLDAAVEAGREFPATAPEPVVVDDRVDLAVGMELASLDGEERFLLASYYLDGRTLADIAKLQRVHESTISRRLERITSGLRKRIVQRLVRAGMAKSQADELMNDIDVRDLRVRVNETLRQKTADAPFYNQKGES